MAQISIAAFHRVRLTFVGQRVVGRIEAVYQARIGGESITVVCTRLQRAIYHCLQRRCIPFRHHCPTHNGVRGAIKCRYDVDAVFLCPTNVYNSSNSTVSTCSGVGGGLGTWSAAALTQLITVW